MQPIGILALQGDVYPHEQALERCQIPTLQIRQPSQLAAIDGLVIPGGETTALLKLMAPWDFIAAIQDFAAQGKPIAGTCAGAILLAKNTIPAHTTLGLLDITVERNAYGRQIDSFIADADDDTGPLVFIRAPKITTVGSNVDVLLTYQHDPVLVRQANILAATFHPEMAGLEILPQFFAQYRD